MGARGWLVWSAVLLVVTQAGCAGRGTVPLAPAQPLAAVGELEREACEALARGEAEAVRHNAEGSRLAERESFHRHASARLSEAASLGSASGRFGPTTVRLEAQTLTVGAAVLLIAVEKLTQPIRLAVESASRQTVAYEAAMRDCVRVATMVQSPGRAPLETARSLHRLGSRYLAQGRYAEAERLYGRALAIRGHDLFPTHTAVAESLQGLVALYRARGQYADAVRLQAWLRQPIGDDKRTPAQVAQEPGPPCTAPGC